MKAKLINHMGEDLTVVNAARVSFDKVSEWEDISGDANWFPNGKFPELTKIMQIGYVASEDKKVLTLADAYYEHEGEITFGGMTTIPKSVIVKRKVIKL